jgi:hypothetical protein
MLDRDALAGVYGTWTNSPTPLDRMLAPSMAALEAVSPDRLEPRLAEAWTLVAAARGSSVRLVITDGCDECERGAAQVARISARSGSMSSW